MSALGSLVIKKYEPDRNGRRWTFLGRPRILGVPLP